MTEGRQRIVSEIVREGDGWRIERVEAWRQPLMGSVITTGTMRQRRWVEQGGCVYGRPGEVRIAGRGHTVEIPPGSQLLYVPIGDTEAAVEWVLKWSEEADPEALPSVSHDEPRRDPVPIPPADLPDAGGMYPDWAEPWLTLPTDVGTWASCLDIHATSLAQRLDRLVGVSPKKILTGMRATVAFALADHYRGRGIDLALDAGYSSHSHLSRDISRRFGVPLSQLAGEETTPELDWLRLVRSVVR